VGDAGGLHAARAACRDVPTCDDCAAIEGPVSGLPARAAWPMVAGATPDAEPGLIL
jgi:hypothetical protein